MLWVALVELPFALLGLWFLVFLAVNRKAIRSTFETRREDLGSVGVGRVRRVESGALPRMRRAGRVVLPTVPRGLGAPTSRASGSG